MQTSKLNSFIKKYALNGNVESVKWSIQDKTSVVNFVTPDKTLIGQLTENNVDIEDSEIGIYNTAALQKILSVFNDTVDISINKIDDMARIMILKDKNSEVKFMLSDLSVIPASPKHKNMPKFEFSMTITDEFINKFIKAKNALPDISHVTFSHSAKDGKSEMIIGYSKNNTTRIISQIDGAGSVDINFKSFNSNYLKDILTLNDNTNPGQLMISSAGLMKVEFMNKDYSSEYYLVEVNHL